MFYPNERTFVLIDGSNFHYQTQNLSLKTNWKLFREWIESQTQLIRVVYYTAVETQEDGSQPMRKLLDYLNYNGFDVREKKAKIFTSNERRQIKGNVDVEIAVDMMKYATNGKADNILLLSGDGDFSYAIENAKSNGARVGVLGSIKSDAVSNELRRAADYFIDFNKGNYEWLSGNNLNIPVTEGQG